jgi:hypothetical protein
MQEFYALPFALLSVVGYVSFLLIPRLRQHALQALVAPIAFAVCSLTTLVFALNAFALADPYLHVVALGGPIAVGTCLLLYLCGGACGTWLAVSATSRIERRLLISIRAKHFILRIVVALIVFGLVSFISMAFAEGLNLTDSPPTFLLMAGMSFFVGVLAAALASRLVRKTQMYETRETFSVE